MLLRVNIKPSDSYDDSLFYSSMEFLEAIKRAKTCKFMDCQLMDRMYLRTQGTLSKTWVVADFKLSDATLLAFKVGKGSSDQQPESGWWRDTSRLPIKSLALSKDLMLENMVLEDSNNKKGQRMFTSKLVDLRTKKTVLRFGTRESSTYEAFANGMKAVLKLKNKGRRSSIQQFRGNNKTKQGLGFFEITILDQGSIGLVLAMSNAGYPVVTQ